MFLMQTPVKQVEDRVLSVVSCEKDLGVWISADVKCSKQSRPMYACNKAMKVLGMIKRTIRFKDTRVMLSLQITGKAPHVEYCISAWNTHYKKERAHREGSEEIYRND